MQEDTTIKRYYDTNVAVDIIIGSFYEQISLTINHVILVMWRKMTIHLSLISRRPKKRKS
jgi:hypothetical protein